MTNENIKDLVQTALTAVYADDLVTVQKALQEANAMLFNQSDTIPALDECWHCGKPQQVGDSIVEVWAIKTGTDDKVLIDQMCKECSAKGQMTTITSDDDMHLVAEWW